MNWVFSCNLSFIYILFTCVIFLILFENFYKKIPNFHTMWFTPYIFPPTSCFCLTMHATCPWQHTRGGRAILQGGTSSGWAELVSAHIRWARAGQWWMGGNISRPNWVSWYYHVELFFSIKDKDDWSQVIPYKKKWRASYAYHSCWLAMVGLGGTAGSYVTISYHEANNAYTKW